MVAQAAAQTVPQVAELVSPPPRYHPHALLKLDPPLSRTIHIHQSQNVVSYSVLHSGHSKPDLHCHVHSVCLRIPQKRLAVGQCLYCLHVRQEGLSGVQLLTRASVLHPLVTLPIETRHTQASWALSCLLTGFNSGCYLLLQPALLCPCYMAPTPRIHLICTTLRTAVHSSRRRLLSPLYAIYSHIALLLAVTATLCCHVGAVLYSSSNCMTAVTITLQARVSMSVLLMQPHTAQSVNKRRKAGVTT